ncbi:MAG: DUF72 domain-containing protein [Candidatus Hodarchaeota archaeon]
MTSSISLTLIGTSGWMYNHWKGPFYPKKISNEEMLNFYTDHFSTVETNSTFYRLPSEKTVKNWKNKTPEHFIYAVKANQFITHRKYLKDGRDTTKKFFDRIELMGNKIGPILFQLPPKWNVNFERLKEFVEILPNDYLYVFEFRNNSWYTQKIYDLFKKYNIALCIHDLYGKITPQKITADFTYIRFHGASGRYYGDYPTEVLDQWAQRIYRWIQQKIRVFAYFNNDAFGWATKNALELKSKIENLIFF